MCIDEHQKLDFFPDAVVPLKKNQNLRRYAQVPPYLFSNRRTQPLRMGVEGGRGKVLVLDGSHAATLISVATPGVTLFTTLGVVAKECGKECGEECGEECGGRCGALWADLGWHSSDIPSGPRLGSFEPVW